MLPESLDLGSSKAGEPSTRIHGSMKALTKEGMLSQSQGGIG